MKTKIKWLWCRIAGVRTLFLLIGGLTGWISSCETEYIADLPEDRLASISAKEDNFKIDIRFADFGEPDLLPSVNRLEADFSTRIMEPATDVIRVNDGLFIYATLAVDPVDKAPPVTARAFTSGAKIRLAVYDSASVFTKVDDWMYTVTGSGTLIREGETTGILHLPAGNYKMIAYSYNNVSVAPPAWADTLADIDPVNDLIWGVSPTVAVVEGPLTSIPITMYHKLSQVTLVAKTRNGLPLISAFSNVSIPGYKVDMETFTGIVSIHSDTPFDQAFNFSTPMPADSVKSETRTVYTGTPGDMPTIIRIGSMTVNDTTLTDIPATFAKSLQSGYSYTMTMRIGDSPDLTDQNPAGVIPFVGAFWKAGQKGERLIRLSRTANGNMDGIWTAQVIAGKDWIVLDTVMTTDPNVGWRTGTSPVEANVDNGNDSGFETNPDRQLPAGKSFVSGNLQASTLPDGEQIYFRIGLKDTYTPTTEAPARYGLVLLTYGQNNYRQRIWIRQGEEADYAPGQTGSAQWSPYNLTMPTFVPEPEPPPDDDDGLPPDGSGVGGGGFVGSEDKGLFTGYPSQAGFFFQWTHNQGFHPITPINTMPDNWETNSFEPFGLSGICPIGYVVPNGGAGSDLTTLLTANIAMGYYADGWFDRRLIVQSVTYGSVDAGYGNSNLTPPYDMTAVSSTVNIDPKNTYVAYIGILFYSPATNASIFFPTPGFRFGEDMGAGGSSAPGALWLAGRVGEYWSSTEYTGFGGLNMAYSLNFDIAGNGMPVGGVWVNTGSAGTGRQYRSYGASIRCVKGELPPEPELSVGPRITWDAANGKYILTDDPIDAGLYFKFGSVVGVFSGSGGETQDLSGGGNSNGMVPGGSDIAWSPVAIADWAGIPYSGTAANVYDPGYHTLTNVLSGKGDPCRLVGLDLAGIKAQTVTNIDNGKWRLPTLAEAGGNFADFMGAYYNYGTVSGIGGFYYHPPGGIPSGTTFDPSFLPFVGSVNALGEIFFQSSQGTYWTGNANGTLSSFTTLVSNMASAAIGGTPAEQNSGCAVRCVRQ
ncbi:MAG: fimbrillin family protein [Tannerella sp.]|jgi:hypothetical protein|nr:fimbrillin family protein [Tannerella sp.]